MVNQVFERDFGFPENLFPSKGIENFQNLQCLSHKNILTFQKDDYFENP